MVITRATDYAVRILAVLSNANGKRLTLADLAAATSVPRDYVPKVLTPLVRRSWVQSYRGAGGGYSLAGLDPNVSLLDVVELYEGPLHLQTCTGPQGCEFVPSCPAHRVWLEAEEALCGVLAKYKIAELAALSRRQGLFIAATKPGEQLPLTREGPSEVA